MAEKNKKEEVILTEAIKDIDQELKNLRIQRKRLETILKGIGEDITTTQSEESKLREQISILVGKEGMLDRKRNRLKERLNELSGKIEKVSKIKEELSEV